MDQWISSFHTRNLFPWGQWSLRVLHINTVKEVFRGQNKDPEKISKCLFPVVGMELRDLHLLGKYFLMEFYFQAHALALDQKEDNLGPFSFLCNCTYPVEEDLVTSSCSSNREWRSEKQVVFVIHEPALGPGLSDCDLGSNSSNLKGKICLL